MILRVQDYEYKNKTENIKTSRGRRWWTFGEITRMATEFVEIQTAYKIPNISDVVICDPSKIEKKHEFCRISFRQNDNTEKVIYFDSIGFLLNENGKTVEKFNPIKK